MVMGTVKVVLSDEVEQWLRSKLRRKGDLSRIVEEAIRTYWEVLERGERQAEATS